MKERFNDLSVEELIAKREELSNKLQKMRFDMVLGHVENRMDKRNLRRSIARLNTMVNEFDLGIRKA
ncbi:MULTISPECIES: 50S ribosomal protein L29 [unclassified Oceanispirochaeta]|uniref:50S ribosomal protein L29 n=1 Tax=unclassified Oceanispirochaeta TaxID=2635722 RepID=UPI000E098FEC|nr:MULTISPECIES: 50S ribosomal protein L29 [unclassified Oceanispirochaeta]MBF9017137.1 50S ribosomal protein L29 [Oceanispirochaeta sp. M2]NPD73586.1 50S ribosomal protein L29 [Oceanispirochaeta sp. M1]RDG30690.1 50S ribosomal protein L29 [Oceanispirochaeta sp. M1]